MDENALPPPIHLRLSLACVVLALLLATYGSGVAAQPVVEFPPSQTATAESLLVVTPATAPTPLPTPRPTSNPVFLTATVWSPDLQVPVLLYHHFTPNNGVSDPTHTRLGDFEAQLQAFYDSGYSLIPLENWLAGDLRLPAGRRPLILTIDDLFFADQIFLDEDGVPSPNSGLGVLWRFSQAHPDFGFSASLFFNLGDKDYANLQAGSTYIKGAGWQDALARAIVWSIEHDAIPYNHFFRHPYLDHLTPQQITTEAVENDFQLRSLLERAGRPDLIARLGNVLALPYGHWPVSQEGKQALYDYVSPEGVALQGIMEVGEAAGTWYLQPVFSSSFDRNHIPRRVGGVLVTDELTTHRDRVPTAEECPLPPVDASQADQVEALQAVLRQVSQSQACPSGIYALQGMLFRVSAGSVEQLLPKK